MGQYRKAESVADACAVLQESDGTAEVIAGGQTLMLNIRQGLKHPGVLVDISAIDRIRGVSEEDGTLRIGGATTYATIARSRIVRDSLPFLAGAMSEIAGPQVRHNGTIGGGLCYGDPALDSPPVLLTLDSDVVLEGLNGTRRVPLSEFFVGYYATDLDPTEILTDIVVPTLPDGSGACYRTVTPRQGDYAIAGVATRLTFDGDTCEVARIGLTNAGDTPMRATDAELVLEGTDVSDDKVASAASEVVDALDVFDDPQVPKSYRETVFRRLAVHTIERVRDEVTN